jgi:hypothetical protein
MLSIKTLSIKMLSIKMLSIKTLSIKTLSIETLFKLTPNITALSITLCRVSLKLSVRISPLNVAMLNAVVMIVVEPLNNLCLYSQNFLRKPYDPF